MSRAYTEEMAKLAFMQKVKIDEETGCWNWQGARDGGGYGVMTWKGRNIRAHRQSYEWRFGALPEGKYACHQCDNRRCVNPEHLRSGSASENLKEAWARGRTKGHNGKGKGSGEESGTNILTEADVKSIRQRRREGCGYLSLAEEYGVSETTVRFAAEGKRWGHLEGAITPREREGLSWRGKMVRGENNRNVKLTEAKVLEIRSRAAGGELPSHFNKEYGVSLSVVCDVIKRKIWRHI